MRTRAPPCTRSQAAIERVFAAEQRRRGGRRRLADRGAGRAPVVIPLTVPTALRIAFRQSAMLGKRSDGFLASARSIASVTCGATVGRTVVSRGTGSIM